MIDLYLGRGIAYVIRSPESTFRGRFDLIFGEVTGVNPRMHDADQRFEERAVVKEVRFAQEMLMRFAAPKLYPPARALPVALPLIHN